MTTHHLTQEMKSHAIIITVCLKHSDIARFFNVDRSFVPLRPGCKGEQVNDRLLCGDLSDVLRLKYAEVPSTSWLYPRYLVKYVAITVAEKNDFFRDF